MIFPADCLLQTCFSLWECNIARVDIPPKHQLTNLKGIWCEILLYLVLYSARKNRLVMN